MTEPTLSALRHANDQLIEAKRQIAAEKERADQAERSLAAACGALVRAQAGLLDAQLGISSDDIDRITCKALDAVKPVLADPIAAGAAEKWVSRSEHVAEDEVWDRLLTESRTEAAALRAEVTRLTKERDEAWKTISAQSANFDRAWDALAEHEGVAGADLAANISWVIVKLRAVLGEDDARLAALLAEQAFADHAEKWNAQNPDSVLPTGWCLAEEEGERLRNEADRLRLAVLGAVRC